MAPSGVWQYFEKLDRGSRVKCLKCRKVLSYCNSTSSLMKHLDKIHKIHNVNKSTHEGETDSPTKLKVKDVHKKSDTSSATIDDGCNATNSFSSAEVVRATGGEGPIVKYMGNMRAFSANGIRTEECTNALIYMIAKDTMPLSTTEREGFRKFVKVLQPLYNIPSEPTITKKIGEKYLALRNLVGEVLSKTDVTLTCDLWTEKSTMRSYLGMTAHYVGGNNLESVELGAKLIAEKKTSANLKIALQQVCDDWNISHENVRAVVSDGGSNIKAAIKELFGAEKHISCFAHLLNGIGQRAIGLHESSYVPSESDVPAPDLPDRESDVEEEDPDETVLKGQAHDIKSLIFKVKKIVTFFRHSEVATTELSRLQREELGKPDHQCVKLIQEVRTRWNSTFSMLDRYLQLSSLVTRTILLLQRTKSSKAKPPDILTAEEEEGLCEIRELLEPLWLITKEISSEKSLTLSKCIPLVKILKQKTAAFGAATQMGIKLQQSLLAEIEMKFRQIEFVKMYALSTILDPRFKKMGFGVSDKTALALAQTVNNVGELVSDLQNTVQQKMNVDTSKESRSRDQLWDDLDELVDAERSDNSYRGDVAGGLPIEVRQFLNRPPVPRKMFSNPLEAWDTIKEEYPSVYRVAIRYLPIVATSVPCERLFSHAGQIVSQLRTRLTGQHIDQLIFLRSCNEKFWFT